jgi:hypothetical protein
MAGVLLERFGAHAPGMGVDPEDVIKFLNGLELSSFVEIN